MNGCATPDCLVHLCSASDWARAQIVGELIPESLSSSGFVHLSTPQQVHLPANRLFGGARDLVLLQLDPTKLSAPLRWEPGVAGDPVAMLFPHLYGPLPVSAVTGVVDYRPDVQGRFAPYCL